jgi:hypothetical protein
MRALSLYRHLLRLYPAAHRDRFGEEMVSVFGEMRAEAARMGIGAQLGFYVRETAGLMMGALEEHRRARGGGAIWLLFRTLFFSTLLFPTRRVTMHSEFRFPKTTAVLMTIILAGVVLAIKKGETISSSHVNPPIGPLPPTHSVLLGGIFLTLAFFYAAGLIGWAILFAMRRSGVHRLAETTSK